MHKDLKTVGLWSLYVAILMLISGSMYVAYPPPEPPRAWITAEPVANQPGQYRVVVRVEPSSLVKLDVPYELGGDAVADQDFTIGDTRDRAATIPIGESEAPPIILRPIPRRMSDDESFTEVQSAVVVTLKPLGGYVTDPEAAERGSRVSIPIKVVRPEEDEPYQVSVLIDGEERDGARFDEAHPRRTVEFRLDRDAKRNLRLRYDLEGGTALRDDFTVLSAPRSGTLTIKKGKQKGILTLERSPLETITRGLGDRRIDVRVLEDAHLRIPPLRSITVPDPKADLAWSVDPRKIDASLGGQASARLVLKPGIAQRVAVRYAVKAANPDLAFTPTDAVRTLTLNPRETRSEPQSFDFPQQAMVGKESRRLLLQPLGIDPAEVFNLDTLPPLEVIVAEPSHLPGDLLAILILNDEMARNQAEVLKELKIATNGQEKSFVGGSAYLLAKDGKIYRMPAGREFDGRSRFNDRDGAETILKRASQGVTKQFGDRINPREIVLVWIDDDGKDAGGEEPFDGFPNTSWRAINIGPPGGLLKLLQKHLPSDAGRSRVTPKEQIKGLGAMLRGLSTNR